MSIERHGQIGDQHTFHTTTDFWECNCDTKSIHSGLDEDCHRCEALRDESPNARVGEILEIMNS